jgi:hypothetical protein
MRDDILMNRDRSLLGAASGIDAAGRGYFFLKRSGLRPSYRTRHLLDSVRGPS